MGNVRSLPQYATAVAAVAIVATLVAGCGPENASEQVNAPGSSLIRPPGSLAEMVGDAEIVARVTVVERVGSREAAVGPTVTRADGSVQQFMQPVVSYRLRVDRYVKGTGADVIVLQIPIASDPVGRLDNVPREGDSFLAFLVPETTWGEGGYGAWPAPWYGRMHERGSEVVFGDGEPVAFARGQRLVDLESEILALEP